MEFYREVVQVVLLFGAYIWVLSAAMEKQLAGVHTFFLRQVTGKRPKRQHNGTWRRGGAKIIMKAEVTQDIHVNSW